MIRKSHYFREDQIEDLKKLPGTESDKIRIALDHYIKKFLPKAIESPSGRKSV